MAAEAVAHRPPTGIAHVPTDNDRLQQAMGRNALGQRFHLFRGEILPRLRRIAVDLVDVDAIGRRHWPANGTRCVAPTAGADCGGWTGG